MYPTLYPYGIGGFEDPSRQVTLSLQVQTNYYFDITDRSFRYHNVFMFVIFNIIQRRTAHLHTYFTVKKSNFESVAKKLCGLSADLIKSVAIHLQREQPYNDLSPKQRDVFDLLKNVNTIATKIPGSQASKLLLRNEIRSYTTLFGLPHIYLTMNPNPVHSPIFQVMFGDEEIDLSKRFPELAEPTERAHRLAKDPIAAADFFQFCIDTFFEHLMGWVSASRKSSENGGLFGHIRVYYGTTEFTERGCLHGHFLI
ncbi:hypothetical protein M422DRAFT_193996 [Sphaerobolus stellatus SS14]|uniref:Helitron helicase-like domain-containing protein n=1 Tax=Sphaerobolus stellatus (strain SS14) TaxID=990650 RepID=A0A0C9U7F0_SPHS4|nr:hypothetical protein M422DRAFT_193996 [Sphaerobolus stellatus SS14]